MLSRAMRWMAKAVVQKALSYAPRGEQLNYVLQRRVLRSLPGTDAHLRAKFGRALQHVAAYRAHGPQREPSCYEFGAGWDLIVPLAYYALGFDRQTLVDVRPIVRVELVNDSIARFARLRTQLEEDAGRALRPVGAADVAGIDDLERRFGIVYLAPRDARDTGLDAASFDLITSTDTAEHVPHDDLRAILVECRRLLRPDGLLSFRADLEDHYSRFDRSISRYNFLRYSDRTWSLLNPALHYQNRLRYPEYVRLVRDAGFEIAAESVSRASDADLEALRRLELAPRYRNGWTEDDLAVRGVTIIATPAR
jgi:SAM-dependent methyltransferase